MNDESFDLEIRRSIYNYVFSNPGTHLRKISRDSDIPLSTLRYHLDYLEREEFIVSKKEENLKTYFVVGRLTPKDKNLTPLLQQKRFRDIVLVIAMSPGLSHSDIADKLSMKLSTLSKYLKILQDREIIYFEKKGREKSYYLTDEKRVMQILLTYKRSFWDSFVDHALELYYER